MRFSLSAIVLVFSALAFSSPLAAQQPAAKQFPPGLLRRLDDLPPGRFRSRIERLPAPARDRAVAWLGAHHLTPEDFSALQVDPAGGVFYADEFQLPAEAPVATIEPEIAQASVPIDPFPADIIFHSKPGAPNVLYLDFTGATVSNTAWNDSEETATFEALPFSSDSDYSTFSDSERATIKRVWQRVAEDYAAFDIDVTTERPASFTTRTAHALVTRNTDANGVANPASTAGGVAYLGTFGSSNFARYRPAWIYHNNLSHSEAYIAEALSHEIGHNMGLSHDGKTSGLDYYGGHGSGDTSWGPLMGTGYNRNVSQWSKGEYYQANNTQDDLATIAGKISYRSDDHGNSIASASSLLVAADGSISSTTPENDPENLSSANKGILEKNTDSDVFSFATGTGQVTLHVDPWVVPSGSTRGGNLDLLIQLHSASGQILLANNAADATEAMIQTNLTEGIYYLTVKATGAGDPMNSTPSGYTTYGNLGQYFIGGSVIPSGVAIPPGAELAISDITSPGLDSHTFSVVYSDNAAIDISTIGDDDLQVTGPNGYTQTATLVSLDQNSNGSPRTATYRIQPPAAAWTSAEDGVYSITMLPNSVVDTESAFVPTQSLGTFEVSIPNAVYVASMDSDPGWTLSGQWEYGPPQYAGTGPVSGATGANILGYNLAGNYENRLSPTYATTPAINCAGLASATLRFQRFLRLRSGDTANIQISTNGSTWSDLWSTTQTVADDSWRVVQFPLPAWALTSTLRIRWGHASGQNQNDIGWNIDDVAILAPGGANTTVQQALILGQTSVIVPEQGQATFTVRLAAPPTSEITVTSSVISGDPDIAIVSGDSHTFTAENWDIPASVTLAAAFDADTVPGAASIQCSAPGLPAVNILATEKELPAPPEISSISRIDTSARLTISGTTGVQYVVEASPDLLSWTPFATNTASSATFVVQDPSPGTIRFYRVTTR